MLKLKTFIRFCATNRITAGCTYLITIVVAIYRITVVVGTYLIRIVRHVPYTYCVAVTV
jgi:hypothetical protein